MISELLKVNCDQLILEFANREMKEIDLLKEISAIAKWALAWWISSPSTWRVRKTWPNASARL